MRRIVVGSLFAAALALLGSPSVLADDAKLAAPKEDEAFVKRLLGRNEAERAAARKELDVATPERLRVWMKTLVDLISEDFCPPPPAVIESLPPPVPAPPPLPPSLILPPRPEPGTVVNLEVRFLQMEAETARRWSGNEAADGRVHSRAVSLEDVEKILVAMEKGSDVQTVTASRITVYDRQKATVQVMNQVSYVKEFQVERSEGSMVANPVIATLAEGLSLDLQPTIAAEGKRIDLEFEVSVRRLAKPMEEVTLVLEEGKPSVKVSRPEVDVRGWSKTLPVADGGTLLLSGLGTAPGTEGTVLVVLITAKTEKIEALASPEDGPPTAK